MGSCSLLQGIFPAKGSPNKYAALCLLFLFWSRPGSQGTHVARDLGVVDLPLPAGSSQHTHGAFIPLSLSVEKVVQPSAKVWYLSRSIMEVEILNFVFSFICFSNTLLFETVDFLIWNFQPCSTFTETSSVGFHLVSLLVAQLLGSGYLSTHTALFPASDFVFRTLGSS